MVDNAELQGEWLRVKQMWTVEQGSCGTSWYQRETRLLAEGEIGKLEIVEIT